MGEQSFRAGHRHRGDFLQRTLQGLLDVLQHASDAERLAAGAGLLQRLDPRVKTLGLLALVLTAVFVQSLLALAGIFTVAVALALLSRIRLWRLARQVWFGVLFFTGLIALPALVMVPGEALVHLPLLDWTVTWQGARSAAFLLGRAETAATLVLLLVLTTPWPHLLKSLRSLGVPLVLVAILGMTYRYIFVLLTTATSMLEARRSRLLGRLSGPLRRRVAISSLVVLLDQALHLGSEVHLAMLARGYRGELHLLHDFRTAPRDWLFLAGLLAVAALALGLSAMPSGWMAR